MVKFTVEAMMAVNTIENIASGVQCISVTPPSCANAIAARPIAPIIDCTPFTVNGLSSERRFFIHMLATVQESAAMTTIASPNIILESRIVTISQPSMHPIPSAPHAIPIHRFALRVSLR